MKKANAIAKRLLFFRAVYRTTTHIHIYIILKWIG